MATLAEQLSQARAALHEVKIGHGVVSVMKDGRRVEFRAANVADLERYVNDLQAHLAASGGQVKPRRNVARFY